MTITDAKTARFIKLGRKGEWESDCIKSLPGTIRLGFNNPHHEACLAGDWETVTQYYLQKKKKSSGKATEITNQIKDFYTLDQSTIWITFFQKKMFWCFASSEVTKLKNGNRIRETINGWSDKSIGGNVLTIDQLSGLLTKTQGFRGTICSVKAIEYLKCRLRDEVLPSVTKAIEQLRDLEKSLVPLICSMNWKDFELLCDLIFANAGWQRQSRLGGTEKSIDLDLMSPVTKRRLFVQVKSESTRETFLDYLKDFVAMDQYDEMYFVVHSPKGDVSTWSKDCDKKVEVFDAEDIARLTVSAGLTDWLIKKCS